MRESGAQIACRWGWDGDFCNTATGHHIFASVLLADSSYIFPGWFPYRSIRQLILVGMKKASIFAPQCAETTMLVSNVCFSLLLTTFFCSVGVLQLMPLISFALTSRSSSMVYSYGIDPDLVAFLMIEPVYPSRRMNPTGTWFPAVCTGSTHRGCAS